MIVLDQPVYLNSALQFKFIICPGIEQNNSLQGPNELREFCVLCSVLFMLSG